VDPLQLATPRAASRLASGRRTLRWARRLVATSFGLGCCGLAALFGLGPALERALAALFPNGGLGIGGGGFGGKRHRLPGVLGALWGSSVAPGLRHALSAPLGALWGALGDAARAGRRRLAFSGGSAV